MMGTRPLAVEFQVKRAKATNAPADAIHEVLDEEGFPLGSWYTWDHIKVESTKKDLHELMMTRGLWPADAQWPN